MRRYGAIVLMCVAAVTTLAYAGGRLAHHIELEHLDYNGPLRDPWVWVILMLVLVLVLVVVQTLRHRPPR